MDKAGEDYRDMVTRLDCGDWSQRRKPYTMHELTWCILFDRAIGGGHVGVGWHAVRAMCVWIVPLVRMRNVTSETVRRLGINGMTGGDGRAKLARMRRDPPGLRRY